MAAYYNEIDPQKSAWLRELISVGEIAPGDVDERSIRDVQPDDIRGYTQCHFFAGVGIWSYALRLAGWPDDRATWTGSCPCQPFSAAGKGEAFNDERHLWPDWLPLIEARRPLVCFGEQVASIDGLTWFDLVHSDMDREDYTIGCTDTCAAGFGAPHRRQRLYWVADYSGSRRREECSDSRRCSAGDGPQGMSSRSEPSGIAGQLGNSSGAGLEEWPGIAGNTGQECAAIERTGDAGRMEDSMRTERRADLGQSNGHRQAPGRNESADWAGERSEVERLDNPAGARSNGTVEGAEGNPRDDARMCVPSERGPVNGFWRSADWVLTRPQRVGDRPGLRPVERGSFPLAHGATARVGRLRGYGDGIVAPQAAAFIRAYMETRK